MSGISSKKNNIYVVMQILYIVQLNLEFLASRISESAVYREL